MRPEKETMLAEIRSKVEGKGFVILADFQGMDVAKTADLRGRLRGAAASYSVVKNSLMSRVAAETGLAGLDRGLSGPTALVSGDGDVVEVAKILKAFIKENDKSQVKVAAFSGSVITAEEVDQLASLPPRIELLGRLVGTIAAPMTQLVGVMNQKLCSLVYVLQAVRDKKEKA
jgi:large subunit ribosomal protein L10